eukprot:TRINITY_DN2808_c0_g3_i9.p1 TRINITY_DN2808_c0_g3~~TRINITY_DN2808_c0_g3_i9.p1  ORF type:complete len:603 (+),score=276.02 TRINITY_DN2808_c0_g3_i9:73-1881(+)
MSSSQTLQNEKEAPGLVVPRKEWRGYISIKDKKGGFLKDLLVMRDSQPLNFGREPKLCNIVADSMCLLPLHVTMEERGEELVLINHGMKPIHSHFNINPAILILDGEKLVELETVFQRDGRFHFMTLAGVVFWFSYFGTDQKLERAAANYHYENNESSIMSKRRTVPPVLNHKNVPPLSKKEDEGLKKSYDLATLKSPDWNLDHWNRVIKKEIEEFERERVELMELAHRMRRLANSIKKGAIPRYRPERKEPSDVPLPCLQEIIDSAPKRADKKGRGGKEVVEEEEDVMINDPVKNLKETIEESEEIVKESGEESEESEAEIKDEEEDEGDEENEEDESIQQGESESGSEEEESEESEAEIKDEEEEEEEEKKESESEEEAEEEAYEEEIEEKPRVSRAALFKSAVKAKMTRSKPLNEQKPKKSVPVEISDSSEEEKEEEEEAEEEQEEEEEVLHSKEAEQSEEEVEQPKEKEEDEDRIYFNDESEEEVETPNNLDEPIVFSEESEEEEAKIEEEEEEKEGEEVVVVVQKRGRKPLGRGKKLPPKKTVEIEESESEEDKENRIPTRSRGKKEVAQPRSVRLKALEAPTPVKSTRSTRRKGKR